MITKIILFLKKIQVIQEVSNKGKTHPLGRGNSTARRLNPYNPLTYITLTVVFIVGMISFGIIGFWKEVDVKNPFNWE